MEERKLSNSVSNEIKVSNKKVSNQRFFFFLKFFFEILFEISNFLIIFVFEKKGFVKLINQIEQQLNKY